MKVPVKYLCKIYRAYVTAVLRTAYLTGCPVGWKLSLQKRSHAQSCDNRKTLYYTNVNSSKVHTSSMYNKIDRTTNLILT